MQLTKTSIKRWCGTYAYQKGEQLSRGKKVEFTGFDSERHHYTAEVNGAEAFTVKLSFGSNGEPNADCTCPKLGSFDSFCQHIAAVLLRIYDTQQTRQQPPAATTDSTDGSHLSGRTSSSQQIEAVKEASSLSITERILGLFADKPSRPLHNKTLIETRLPLHVEYILKLHAYNPSTALFSLELKLGPKNVYVVNNIPSFLDQLSRGLSYPINSRFRYDPELHTFTAIHEQILQILIELVQDQGAFLDDNPIYSLVAAGPNRNRMLLLPPKVWTKLRPLLGQAPRVTLLDGAQTFEQPDLAAHAPLPLFFRFDQTAADPAAYELTVSGLDQLTVMEPYQAVLWGGRLIELQAKACKQLAELRMILPESSGSGSPSRVPVPYQQAEAFVEKVLPGLKRLGSVELTAAVAQHVRHFPLKAKLYLDRVKDRLLAAVEFQYGDVTINPLEEDRKQHDPTRILIRDTEKERRILDILEQSPFARTEAGLFMNEEEAEFEFLHGVVPQLEPLMAIYATSAVKVRVLKGPHIPKLSVKIDPTERINWMEFKLNMGWIPETEIRQIIQALEEKRRYYRLPNGSLMPLDLSELEDISRLMIDMGLQHKDLKGAKARVPLSRGLQLMDQEYGGVTLDKTVRQLLHNLKFPDNLDFPVPNPLSGILRDYQRLGYQWLKTLAHYGFGGILADDMGLGKTLQSITFLTSVQDEIRSKGTPALVISPGSLVYNWLYELRRFAPELRVTVADGTHVERGKKLADLSDTDVVLTSYPLLLRDLEQYSQLSFHTLILDEAQAFKNHTTQTARAVKSIEARNRFALTGTPVENRLEELWSIFDAVFPELFDSQKAFHNLTRKEIIKRARPFMLRRWKHDVLQDLPEKLEATKLTELLPEQKKLYTAYLAKLQQQTLKHLSENGYHKSRIKILAGLTRLRQICCHPGLFVEGYEGSSAKLEQLMEVLEECQSNGKRVLVFSQFTEMLGIISRRLRELDVPYFYLDGTTPPRERVELCSRFNEGEMDLFLISLKAGGTGLNLTGADTVILYDLWWNPAVEQQAADRAHRMGQQNVVQVIRLISVDTMEEKMYELQHKKKQLIDEVMGPQVDGEDTLAALTEEDIRELLRI